MRKMIKEMWSFVVTIFMGIRIGVCYKFLKSGADDQNRTGDLLITNQLLYRLSYIGVHQEFWYLYDGM